MMSRNSYMLALLFLAAFAVVSTKEVGPTSAETPEEDPDTEGQQFVSCESLTNNNVSATPFDITSPRLCADICGDKYESTHGSGFDHTVTKTEVVIEAKCICAGDDKKYICGPTSFTYDLPAKPLRDCSDIGINNSSGCTNECKQRYPVSLGDYTAFSFLEGKNGCKCNLVGRYYNYKDVEVHSGGAFRLVVQLCTLPDTFDIFDWSGDHNERGSRGPSNSGGSSSHGGSSYRGRGSSYGSSHASNGSASVPVIFIGIVGLMIGCAACACKARHANETVDPALPAFREQQHRAAYPSPGHTMQTPADRKEHVKSHLFTYDITEGKTSINIAQIISSSNDDRNEGTAQAGFIDSLRSKMGSLRGRNAPECSICICDYTEGETIAWSKEDGCNHLFHESCITQWLCSTTRNGEYRDACPLCRTKIMTDEAEA